MALANYLEVAVGVVAVALPSQLCAFIKIQNRVTNADESINDKNIYYGDASVQTVEVQPGDSSPWLPVAANASEIYIRTHAGACTIAVTCTNRIPTNA